MLTTDTATWIVRLAALYLVTGIGFAIPFALRWSGRLDPVATHGTAGFRLLVIPAAILLWPLLIVRLVGSRA